MRAPPPDEAALLARARRLVGVRLGEIAAGFGERAPPDLRRAKGWIGRLLERELGATAGPDAAPDFPDLGIELKTVPVDRQGRPRESTWVCVADPDVHATWAASLVRAKLARVLWVCVDGVGPPAERVVRRVICWSPDGAQRAAIRSDWEAHVESLALGELWQVSAHRGRVLQLRPKAGRGADTRWMVGEDGEWVRAQPKGFYLRRRFVAGIVAGACDAGETG